MSLAEGELGGNLLEDAVACMPYPGPHGLGGICDGGSYGVNGYGYPGKPMVSGAGGCGSNGAASALAAFALAFIEISPSFSSFGGLVVEIHPFTYLSQNFQEVNNDLD